MSVLKIVLFAGFVLCLMGKGYAATCTTAYPKLACELHSSDSLPDPDDDDTDYSDYIEGCSAWKYYFWYDKDGCRQPGFIHCDACDEDYDIDDGIVYLTECEGIASHTIYASDRCRPSAMFCDENFYDSKVESAEDADDEVSEDYEPDCNSCPEPVSSIKTAEYQEPLEPMGGGDCGYGVPRSFRAHVSECAILSHLSDGRPCKYCDDKGCFVYTADCGWKD